MYVAENKASKCVYKETSIVLKKNDSLVNFVNAAVEVFGVTQSVTFL